VRGKGFMNGGARVWLGWVRLVWDRLVGLGLNAREKNETDWYGVNSGSGWGVGGGACTIPGKASGLDHVPCHLHWRERSRRNWDGHGCSALEGESA